MRRILSVLVLLQCGLPWLGASGCRSKARVSPKQEASAVAAHASSPAPACPMETDPIERGKTDTEHLREVSGLVVSEYNPGVLWAHNDSGDSPRVFAIGQSAQLLAIYSVSGAEAIDWEGLGIGPGDEPNQFYLYIGDLGANRSARRVVSVYRAREPRVLPAEKPPTLRLEDVTRFDLQYPDHASHDAEGLFIDPRSGFAFIVTKSHDGRSGVYRVALSGDGGIRALEPRLVLNFGARGTVGSQLVTDASITGNGDAILIRTYTDAYYYPRGEGMSVEQALQRQPCRVPLRWEPQGESIALARDGSGYFTLSEGLNQALFWFALLPAGATAGAPL